MAYEQTLVLIKPDGIRRRLTGLTIDRLEAEGLKLVGAKVVSVSEELAREHYRDLSDKPFFANLIRYIQGEFHGLKDHRIVAMIFEGENAVARTRKAAGATNPEEAAPESIRGSFGRVTTKGQFENVLHASGNLKDAEREIKLWFAPDEVLSPLFPTKHAVNGQQSRTRTWA